MANHSCILASRIPWTEEPGRLQSMGLQRVRHNRVTNTHLQAGKEAEENTILPLRCRWWRGRGGGEPAPFLEREDPRAPSPPGLAGLEAQGLQPVPGSCSLSPLSSPQSSGLAQGGPTHFPILEEPDTRLSVFG